MKKMRFSLIAAMLVFVTVASAQVNLGVKGGVNMSNFYGDELTDKNAKVGFHIGLAVDYEFAYNMAIQSGLFFTTKGAKYETDIPVVGNIKAITNANYLQLPVHFAYKLDVTPGTRIVFHAGPYAAFGVGGKRKIDNQWTEALEDLFGSPDIKTFDKDYGFKPFDAGLGLGVGAEFGRIILDLGWDMGLVNISRSSNGNIKTQNAYLSVGYKF